MPPIRPKVVDVQDGKPIAGAHVLFLGTAQQGTDGAPGYTLLTRINTLRVIPDLDEVTTRQVQRLK